MTLGTSTYRLELIKRLQKSTSKYHAIGPECKSRWVNRTSRAKKTPKTSREGRGGSSPERHNVDEKRPSYINFPLVFCGPEGKLRLRVKNDTGYIDLSLGVDKMGPKINKPAPRRRPKSKSRWVNGTNRAKKWGGEVHQKDIDLMKIDHHTSISRSCFADLKRNYDSE